jgi:hypothetical protein
LQSRVAQLESQPVQADLPPGVKLLTLRKGQGSYSNYAALPAADRLREHQGYTIAITPTADMPAPVSEVTVSGEIRVRAIYDTYDIDGEDSEYIDLDQENDDDTSEHVGEDSDAFDITTRARLRIDGRTETAIGEIGGTIRLEGNRDLVGEDADPVFEDVTLNIGWGYWQFAPSWQFGGGYWDSLAAIQAGWDWNGEPSLVGLRAGPTNHSVSQFRLTYSSGGLTAAVSLEDNDLDEDRICHPDADQGLPPNECEDDEDDEKNAVFPSVAGYVAFDAGSFLVTASAIWQPDDDDDFEFIDTNTGTGSTERHVYNFEDTEDNWWVGAGAIIRLSDMFRLEGAVGIGEGYTSALYVSPQNNENDMEYWAASILAVVSFAESWRLELGGAYTSLDHEEDEDFTEITTSSPGIDLDDAIESQWTVAASAFWDPVDQLTIGVGVGFHHGESDDDDAEFDAITAGFGTWFRF